MLSASLSEHQQSPHKSSTGHKGQASHEEQTHNNNLSQINKDRFFFLFFVFTGGGPLVGKNFVNPHQGYIFLQIPYFLGREKIEPKLKLGKKFRREL